MKKKLLVLIGVQGSGKSYFSAQLKSSNERWSVVSSDEYRIDTTGKLDIFNHPLRTFNNIDKLLISVLKFNDFVIYDACNISKLRRMLLFHNLKSIRESIEVTGVVFSVPTKVCLRQNKSKLRDHCVRSYIILISKIISKFNRPNLKEGFDNLVKPEFILEKEEVFFK